MVGIQIYLVGTIQEASLNADLISTIGGCRDAEIRAVGSVFVSLNRVSSAMRSNPHLFPLAGDSPVNALRGTTVVQVVPLVIVAAL